jgi:hypothetical protein
MSKKDRLLENDGYIEDVLTRFNYGDLLSTSYFENLFGVKKEEMEFTYKFMVLKESLIDWGCILKAVLGQGYRILHPREIPAEVYNSYAKSSLKKIQKGMRILNSVDRSELTDEEKQQFAGLDKCLAIMYTNNENTLLTAQALISDTKRKELGN